jgi:type III pantothenate kinase
MASRFSFQDRIKDMRTVLAMDVGNTRVKVALFVSGHIEARLQVPTSQVRDETFLTSQLRSSFGQWATVDACLIASVVKGLHEPLIASIQAMWSVSPVVIHSKNDLGIGIDVPKPEGVGIDRLLEASAAFHILKSGVVVAAFGSAITIDLVTPDGVFRGGTILSGLRMGLFALHQMTSMLPNLEVKAPDGVLGKDTVTCMQAGVVYGAAGAVDRIYEELCVVAGQSLPLIVTGGDVRYVAPLLRSQYQIEEDLVLRGIMALDARS